MMFQSRSNARYVFSWGYPPCVRRRNHASASGFKFKNALPPTLFRSCINFGWPKIPLRFEFGPRAKYTYPKRQLIGPGPNPNISFNNKLSSRFSICFLFSVLVFVHRLVKKTLHMLVYSLVALGWHTQGARKIESLDYHFVSFSRL